MENRELYDPQKQAQEVIESLADTPAGKYFEGESAPDDTVIQDEKLLKKPLFERELPEYHLLLNRDLFNYIDKQDFPTEEREWMERGVLDGDYKDIMDVMHRHAKQKEEEPEVRREVSDLLRRIENDRFQEYLLELRIQIREKGQEK